MDLDARILDVHQRSAKTLLAMQGLQVQAQQVAAAIQAHQAELLRLDGEERALVVMKAETASA